MSNTNKQQYTNRLINEKSPYLLQHAHNPVDWYPWGAEAFEKAKKKNKPIFLSIGYSTCHWCHVMEKESFENEAIAKLLNDNFVSIKVDREERPDIDNIYMAVCQVMTGGGGWPLTIFMTHDKKPFSAGTYFPPDDKFGHVGLKTLLPTMIDAWKNKRDEIEKVGEQIIRLLQRQAESQGKSGLNEDTFRKAFEMFQARFDKKYGGFSNAPKFPQTHSLSFLMRYTKRTGDKDALTMVEKTLDNLARGGIFDHIGYGFHRYATDQTWLVPHFEKMLYDQALIARTFLEAYQLTHKEKYAVVARQIFTYVLRDMTSPQGGFYSAEDADSEGEEGKFYVWTPAEVKKVLGEEKGDIYCKFYGITESGNFEHQQSILHVKTEPGEFARKEKIPLTNLQSILKDGRKKLFTHREKLVHPYKDDKILTAWNGLMISALALGSQVLDEPAYAQAACKSADFILNNLRRPDGRLLRRYRKDEAILPAYLNDYAFLIMGLIDLYETTFDPKWLQTALELNQDMLKLFWDEKDGGFFFTGADAEKLIARRKELYDGALPSANSIAALNLLRLSAFTMDKKLAEKSIQLMDTFSGTINHVPIGYSQMLIALDFRLGPSREIVIAGNIENELTSKILKEVRRQFLPNKIVILHPKGKAGTEIEKIIPFVKYQTMLKEKTTAYICVNHTCQIPLTDLKEIIKLLEK